MSATSLKVAHPPDQAAPGPGGRTLRARPRLVRSEDTPGTPEHERKLERMRGHRLIQKNCIDCGRPFEGVRRARWCPDVCRPAKRAAANRRRRKYEWTPDRLAYIQAHYDEIGARAIAEHFGFPTWQVAHKAAALGLGRHRQVKPWTPAEVAMLEEYAGVRTPRWIARELGRTLHSVVLKIRYVGLSTAIREGYTSHSLAPCFGVSPDTIGRWIRLGYFGRLETRDGEARPQGSRSDIPHHLTDAQVLAFVKAHPTVFDLRKVDQTWFLDLVFKGRVGKGAP